MIPQEAQLFQGTIASNLDPTGAVPEAHLQKALDICQSMAAMKATEPTNGSNTEEDEENGNASNANFTERLSLATTVNAKGENFSHGQRQVLSLCRILVRRSKLMLLDEATSSMDMETDEAIQKALRDEFSDDEGKTRCLITIAHRLQTISDYDKVVVMGSGEVLEHGSPAELMTKKGHFYDMWLHSNEEDTPSRSVA
jgi:ABC-type multidrug transport system fused ATPase/permease subunit